jgi:hypothetical protein
MGSHPEDRSPQFLTKILVTNAPLRMLNPRSLINEIRSASNLEDISTDVDLAIFFSDYGPDYEDHFRSTFKSDADRLVQSAREIGEELRSEGKRVSRYTDPARLIEELSSAERFECRRVSTQFFVATLPALPRLLKAIKLACRASYKTRGAIDRNEEWMRKALKKPKAKRGAANR